MKKPKSPLHIGIGIAGAVLAFSIVVVACSSPRADEQIENIETPEIELIDEAFTVVEVMPEFSGGMESLAAFLGDNIKYPENAKQNGVQGTVIVNFIIEKDGSIGDSKIVRGIDNECDEEALRVVKSMPAWTPGYQRGKAVRVSFNLPIRFKLDEKKTAKNITRITVIDDSVFTVVEDMPEYPGGFEAMSAFLAENIKYPEQAKKDKINGRVFVSFVVEKSGEVSNVKLLRGIGGGCDEEALRVVSNMPNWKPGTQKGKAVRVQYNLPIKFALD